MFTSTTRFRQICRPRPELLLILISLTADGFTYFAKSVYREQAWCWFRATGSVLLLYWNHKHHRLNAKSPTDWTSAASNNYSSLRLHCSVRSWFYNTSPLWHQTWNNWNFHCRTYRADLGPNRLFRKVYFQCTSPPDRGGDIFNSSCITLFLILSWNTLVSSPDVLVIISYKKLN